MRKLLGLESGEAEREDNYWRVIIDCLLQRRIEMAKTLLKLHSKSSSEPFQRMERLLNTMPVFDVHSGISGTEFQIQHECWRKEATGYQRTGHFANNQNLDIIARVNLILNIPEFLIIFFF